MPTPNNAPYKLAQQRNRYTRPTYLYEHPLFNPNDLYRRVNCIPAIRQSDGTYKAMGT